MIEVRLPQYGMGMADGTITTWRKAEGDQVAEGEILCDVEAAKAVIEVEAPASGVLRRILAKEGENVPVNSLIAEMDAA